MNHSESVKILLHAPSPSAVARARSNAANLAKESASLQVRIVVNGTDAVSFLLDTPDQADTVTLICPNTLRRLEKSAPSPLTILGEGAVLAIAHMQQEGWLYVRA